MKISLKDAVALGSKRFLAGYAEHDFPFSMYGLVRKEFVRGWNAGYFENLRRVKEREKKTTEKPYSSELTQSS